MLVLWGSRIIHVNKNIAIHSTATKGPGHDPIHDRPQFHSRQVFNPKFSAATFLSHTKTFHDVYAVLATPAADPVLTFLVSYGHLLIGLSLLVGLMVRVSAAFGVALLVMY